MLQFLMHKDTFKHSTQRRGQRGGGEKVRRGRRNDGKKWGDKTAREAADE